MRVLITGGAGFIGSHLAEAAISQNHEVVALDNLSTGKKANLDSLVTNPNFVFINDSIERIGEIEFLSKESFDVVFHLAAKADIVPSITDPKGYYETNVEGSFKVAEFVRANSIPHLIYAASSSCYGIPDIFPTDEKSQIKPEYPYALTKYLGEQLILHWGKVYGFCATSLRLFNVYGPRARTSGTYGAVFGVFLAQKLAKKPLTVVGDGKQTRDFTYVSDVANAFLAALNSTNSGSIYNVGSGRTYSINYLVSLLGGATVNLPKRPGEPDCTFADIRRIQTELSWTPKVSFEEGVSIILNQIENWKDAPVWDVSSISEATREWFKYLGKKNEYT